MTTTLSGPMFERAQSGPWKSVSGKDGAHYNNYGCRDGDGMAALRQFFKDGEAGELNFVLFSTSGVHGTYGTIEDAEAMMARGNKYEDGEDGTPSVTFLIVSPRICCLRHGNCIPESADDIAFLKKLRESSWRAVQEIGRASQEDGQP
jgi:hypothetical protein